jgi:hypothetical protein
VLPNLWITGDKQEKTPRNHGETGMQIGEDTPNTGSATLKKIHFQTTESKRFISPQISP